MPQTRSSGLPLSAPVYMEGGPCSRDVRNLEGQDWDFIYGRRAERNLVDSDSDSDNEEEVDVVGETQVELQPQSPPRAIVPGALPAAVFARSFDGRRGPPLPPPLASKPVSVSVSVSNESVAPVPVPAGFAAPVSDAKDSETTIYVDMSVYSQSPVSSPAAVAVAAPTAPRSPRAQQATPDELEAADALLQLSSDESSSSPVASDGENHTAEADAVKWYTLANRYHQDRWRRHTFLKQNYMRLRAMHDVASREGMRLREDMDRRGGRTDEGIQKRHRRWGARYAGLEMAKLGHHMINLGELYVEAADNPPVFGSESFCFMVDTAAMLTYSPAAVAIRERLQTEAAFSTLPQQYQ